MIRYFSIEKNRFLRTIFLFSFVFFLFSAFGGEKQGELQILTDSFKRGRLAFTYQGPRSSKKEIFIADFKTNKIKKLIDLRGDQSSPSFSPYGEKVAFVLTNSNKKEIFIVDSNGKNPTKLLSSKYAQDMPAWSPNGNKITFSRNFLNKKSSNIFIINSEIKHQTPPVSLTEDKSKIKNISPDWSPRGDEIVYIKKIKPDKTNIMLYSSVSGKNRRLTPYSSFFQNPTFNRTATIIAYAEGDSVESDIWLQEKGEETSIRLSSLPGRENHPTWIESSKGLFFTGEMPPYSGKFGIFYIDIESKAVIPVIKANKGSILDISWTGFTKIPEISPIPNN